MVVSVKWLMVSPPLMKMSTKQVKNAIMELLKREIPSEKFNIDELGGKIEVILCFLPSKRAQKDKDAPKKTRTAYTFFCQRKRAETVEEMKSEGEEGVKPVDVVLALATKWRDLKERCKISDEDALYEMNEYKAQSMEDMGRYLAESAAYKERSSV